MNKIHVFLFAGFLLFAHHCFVFADTVILKSGKSIQGKIIQATDEYTEIDVFGVPLKYWKDEVEKIERSNVVTSPTPGADLKENTAEQFFKTAVGFMRQKEYKEAITNAESALAIDKNYLPAYAVLEAAYLRLQQFQEAIDTSIKALNINPDDLASNIYIALAYKEIGEKEKAHIYFAKVVSLLREKSRPEATLVEELLKDLNY